MTEKQFKVHAEGYQDTDDMGYAIAPPVIYYHVGNSEIGFNFDTEREAKMLCEAWNKLVEENEQLRKDLIDHSALISMLEDYQALKIEETLWNLTGAKSEEEFNELYKPYLDKAKRSF